MYARIYGSGREAEKFPALVSRHTMKEKDEEMNAVTVYPAVRYQTLRGFGGTFTQASAHNYMALDAKAKAEFNRLYFSEEGLNYAMGRVCIHSSDFSKFGFTYTDKNDVHLRSFSVARDETDVIPMIQDARAAGGHPLTLLASPWSPPGWMKDNGQMLLGGKVKPDCREVWARYMARFVLEYRKRDIPVSAISIQNEPNARQTWESCRYTGAEEAEFAAQYLRPALNALHLDDVKIFGWDHNKERVLERSSEILTWNGGAARDVMDGIAFHWYSGDHFDGLRAACALYPDKEFWLSEYCSGVKPTESVTATWADARAYAHEIIGDLTAGASAIINWNLLLDMKGGPYHARFTGCKAPIHADPRSSSLYPQKTLYALAHFSHFLTPGATRILATSYRPTLETLAFQNPDGALILILLNTAPEDAPVQIRLATQTLKVTLESHSLKTIVMTKE